MPPLNLEKEKENNEISRVRETEAETERFVYMRITHTLPLHYLMDPTDIIW